METDTADRRHHQANRSRFEDNQALLSYRIGRMQQQPADDAEHNRADIGYISLILIEQNIRHKLILPFDHFPFILSLYIY